MGVEAGPQFPILDRVHGFVDGLKLSGNPDVDSRFVFGSGLDFFSSHENFPHVGVNKLMAELAQKKDAGRVLLEVGLFLDHSQRPQGFRRESDRAWVIRLSKDFPLGMVKKTADEWGAIVNIAQQMKALTDLERDPQVSPALIQYLPAEARRSGDEMELDFLKTWRSFDPFYF